MLRASLIALAVVSCSKAPPPKEEPKKPSFRPLLSPAGAPEVTTISDEATDVPERVAVEARLLAPKTIDYMQLDWLLDSVHRQAAGRRGFKNARHPQSVDIRVYDDAAAPRDGYIGRVRSEGGDPVKEIRLPFPLGKEVAKMIAERPDYQKIRPTAESDDAAGKLLVRVPYVDGRTDEHLKKLPYGRALQEWSVWTLDLFAKYPALKELTFVGVHRDKEVLSIRLTDEQFGTLGLRAAEEDLGQFQNDLAVGMVEGTLTEKQVMQKMLVKRKDLYRKVLGRLPKDQVRISRSLR